MALEPLEPRLPLAANVQITEIVADNVTGIYDEEGDQPDWIELHNAGDSTAQLNGWYLTDDAQDRQKWRFPEVELSAHSSLVVFASGKDRTGSPDALHTNFKLSASGEYLALVKPDGNTIASGFTNPGYPALRQDLSYGLTQRNELVSLLPDDYATRVLIPTDAAIDAAWTLPGFDDANWLSGKGALGFSENANIKQLITFDIESSMRTKTASALLRIPFELSELDALERATLSFQYDDGFVAFINGHEVARRNAPDSLNGLSRATLNRAVVTEVLTAETAEIRDIREYARLGTNILAVHALNNSISGSDLLQRFQLQATYAREITSSEGRFFANPSPGIVNGVDSFAGWLAEPDVSVPHGFYETAQDVTIRTPDSNASIAYTIHGDTPASHTGQIAETATLVEQSETTLAIGQTTTLRVAAVRADYLPSWPVTRSYMFVADIVQQSPEGAIPDGFPQRVPNGQKMVYGMDPDIVNDPRFAADLLAGLQAIPSISIVTDAANLFGSKTGIYVNAVKARGQNDQWERPASIELIPSTSDLGFQIDAGLRIRGGFSRDATNPRHGFRVLFRQRYGDGKLAYPLFGDTAAQIFSNLDLRVDQAMGWHWCEPGAIARNGGCEHNTLVRDAFSRILQGDLNQPYARSNFYHLYLNGQYWGIYEGQERGEAEFAASYYGGTAEDYDVIKVESFPHHIEATDGNLDAWHELWDLAKPGFTPATYQQALGLNEDGTRNPDYPVLLDIDNLIDYMLIIFYTGALDSPITNYGDNGITNNWFGFRSRTGEQGFRFLIHDAEISLIEPKSSRIGPYPAGDTFLQFNPQWLHQRLMSIDPYRDRFADRAQKHLFAGGAMSEAANQTRLESLRQTLAPAIVAESARWGDSTREIPYAVNDWSNAVDFIRDEFIPGRLQILINQLRNAHGPTLGGVRTPLLPLYPELDAPTIDYLSGQIRAGQAVSMFAAGTIYYTLDGSDPRVGRETSPAARRYESPLIVTADTILRLRAWQDGQWSALVEAEYTVSPPPAGDVNGDGRFDSTDLILVFQAGQYEDAIAGNSTFATGDWNGDGDFDSQDFVFAFQVGGYVA